MQRLNLSGCRDVTDIDVSALGYECGQLQRLHLSGRRGLHHRHRCSSTGPWMRSAIDNQSQWLLLHHGHRSISNGSWISQLLSINLSDCELIFTGLSALVHGFCQLQDIKLSDSWGITYKGISSVDDWLGELQIIHLRYCVDFTDRTLSALAHGCSQLQTIDIRGCLSITDTGVNGCSQLQHLDLSGRQGITDTGVSH
jgi:hypothetical protein